MGFVSMTGFASRDADLGQKLGSLVLKSYNNRYLDISLSLPPAAAPLEDRIQRTISEGLSRGKVEFALRLRDKPGCRKIQVDPNVAKAAYSSLAELASACGLDEKPSLSLVAAQAGVLSQEPELETEALWKCLEPELKMLAADFGASRIREGLATEQNIRMELDRFASAFRRVEESAGELEVALKKQLASRMEELCGSDYDQGRFLQEVAVLLVRYGINEEISRLHAHIEAFAQLSLDQSPAKKLDFLCQEMNREVNTIGSKNTLIPVAHAVVEMKDALENIREQLRNVE
ncbi:MAG TPA: YicC/YloC family endoribonuclease [Rectinemataceae bacterium]